MAKDYNGLISLPTYEERLSYLLLSDRQGEEMFGELRHLSQVFYHSWSWRDIRKQVIVRDLGCDLGLPGREILGKVYVHHIVPIRPYDIVNRSDLCTDPNNLITVSFDTHQRIHYGVVPTDLVSEREQGDTQLWTPLKGV
jgi:hypothetical protein